MGAKRPFAGQQAKVAVGSRMLVPANVGFQEENATSGRSRKGHDRRLHPMSAIGEGNRRTKVWNGVTSRHSAPQRTALRLLGLVFILLVSGHDFPCMRRFPCLALFSPSALIASNAKRNCALGARSMVRYVFTNRSQRPFYARTRCCAPTMPFAIGFHLDRVDGITDCAADRLVCGLGATQLPRVAVTGQRRVELADQPLAAGLGHDLGPEEGFLAPRQNAQPIRRPRSVARRRRRWRRSTSSDRLSRRASAPPRPSARKQLNPWVRH